jgi:hypothetical protein
MKNNGIAKYYSNMLQTKIQQREMTVTKNLKRDFHFSDRRKIAWLKLSTGYFKWE